MQEQVFLFTASIIQMPHKYRQNIKIKGKRKIEREYTHSSIEVALNRPTIIFIFSCVHKLIQSETRDASNLFWSFFLYRVLEQYGARVMK